MSLMDLPVGSTCPCVAVDGLRSGFRGSARCVGCVRQSCGGRHERAAAPGAPIRERETQMTNEEKDLARAGESVPTHQQATAAADEAGRNASGRVQGRLASFAGCPRPTVDVNGNEPRWPRLLVFQTQGGFFRAVVHGVDNIDWEGHYAEIDIARGNSREEVALAVRQWVADAIGPDTRPQAPEAARAIDAVDPALSARGTDAGPRADPDSDARSSSLHPLREALKTAMRDLRALELALRAHGEESFAAQAALVRTNLSALAASEGSR